MEQTPDKLETHLTESLKTRWPEREITEHQVHTLLANIETKNRTHIMQTRISSFLRPVAFVGGLALLVLALSWIFGAIPPNSASENTTPTAFTSDGTQTENDDNAISGITPTPAEERIVIPTSTSTPEASPTPLMYTVQDGDLCMSIAFAFNVSVQSVIQANALDSQCIIFPGQILLIPRPTPTPGSALNPTELATPIPQGISGFASFPNVTFDFANPLPEAPAQLTFYHQQLGSALTEEAVRQMAARMGLDGEITTYNGEGGDPIYDVTDGNVGMIFFGFPDQFSYFINTPATPTLTDPLPFEQRVTIAEEFLNARGLLTAPYRAEPSSSDPNGVRFVQLLDGIPLNYGIGENPGLIEWITISVHPDGQVHSLYHSPHNFQPMETFPLLTAEQAWARLGSPNAETRMRYAILAAPMHWTREASEPTEALTGYLNNENGGTTFYADDGRVLTLPDIPTNMPLYATLEIRGVVVNAVLEWSEMRVIGGTYGTSLSCGGGGGGGSSLPNANFGGGNFAVVKLAPLALPTPTVLINPLQPGDAVDGAQGALHIIRHIFADGTEATRYNLWHMGDKTNPGWYATLEGEVLAGTESLQNLPIKVWGTVTSVDANGQLVIAIGRYEEAYPGTRIQAWLVTQQIVTMEGQEVVLLTAQDGSQFVSNQSITWGPEGSLAGSVGDTIIVEGYIVPNALLGGYPVINELMTGGTMEADLDNYTIQSNLIGIQDESAYPNPAASLAGHVTIENIELMYAAVSLDRCTPEFADNPDMAHFLYVQPIWRFTGHFDDGRFFEIQIQALPDEYLR